MKRCALVLLAASLLFGSPADSFAQWSGLAGACQYSVAISTAGMGRTLLIAGATGTRIRVCGFSVVVSGAVTVEFDSGTGAACVVAPVALTGAMSFIANSGLVSNSGQGPLWILPAGSSLCVNLGGGQQTSGWVTYDQF